MVDAAPETPRVPLIALSSAVILGAFYGMPNRPVATAVAAVCLVVLAGLIRIRRRRWPPVLLFIAALFSAPTAVWIHLPDPAPLLALAGRTIAIEGRIVETTDQNAYGTQLIIALEEPARGRVRIAVTSSVSELRWGARVRGRAEFAAPDSEQVPSFRARGAAVRRGVVLNGRARALEVVEPPSRVRTAIEAAIADPTTAALALGERGLAEPSALRRGPEFVFVLAGASMLCCVFGLHGVLARRVKVRTAALAAGVLLVALTAAQGASPSALRVAFTAAVILVWSGSGWTDIRRPLMVSIILVLLLDPVALGDVYYQLAVASLTSVITVYPALAERLGRARVLALFPAVALATAPLITRVFDRISVATIAANMLLLPLIIAIVVPVALLGGVVALLSPAVAAVPLGLADLLAHAGLELVRSMPAIATPTIGECTLFYLALFAYSVRPATRGTRRLALFSLVLMLVIAVWPRAERALVDEPVTEQLPGGFQVTDDPQKGVLVVGSGSLSQGTDPEPATRALDNWLKHHRITVIDELVLPAEVDRAVEDAIRRQHEVRSVRYQR